MRMGDLVQYCGFEFSYLGLVMQVSPLGDRIVVHDIQYPRGPLWTGEPGFWRVVASVDQEDE